MKNKKAFAMIEMLLVVGLLSTMFSMYYTGIYKPQKRSLDYEMSLKRELSLREFVKNYIILAAEYNVSLALSSPSSKKIRIEPLSGSVGKNTTSMSLSKDVISNNRILPAQLKLLKCHITGANKKVSNYNNYVCETGENGTRFLFETDYNRASNDYDFNNIYDNVYPIFSIDKVEKNGVSIYGAEYSKKFTFVSLYDSFREKSFEKLQDLKNRLLDFHKKQLLKELRNNCTSSDGGLDSWDDTYIPWIWLVNTTKSSKYLKYTCSSTGGSCKCVNLKSGSNTLAMNTAGMWQTDNKYMSYYSSNSKWNNMLKNLNLPTKYYTVDSVGNFFKVTYFSDGDGATLKDNSSVSYTPPPLPTEYYNETKNYTYKVQGEINIVKKTTGTGNNAYNNASTLFLYE
jgi:hypothetical protein